MCQNANYREKIQDDIIKACHMNGSIFKVFLICVRFFSFSPLCSLVKVRTS